MKPWAEITITRRELPFGWHLVGEVNPRRLLLGASWESGGIDTTHFKHTWRTVWGHLLWLRLVFSWQAQEELGSVVSEGVR
jgi:hypothetical protein